MSRILDRLMEGLPFVGKHALSYEEEKELARHDDITVRRKLAARKDVRPEILYFLAEDAVPEVRKEIAANNKAPRHADLLLAKDKDDDVRCHLSRKIALLIPDITPDDSDRLSRLTFDTLEILVQDQLPRVRAILAETLKDVANVPAHVIQQLARDTEIEVAGPVLRYSPLLTDADLLEIISGDPIQGALVAIAKRAGIREGVSDVLVEKNEKEVITALLGNKSAQIREETLDQIIDQAPGVEIWHEPLAMRPQLSLKAAANIAGFVADSILEKMQGRSDIDPETFHVVKEEVHRRIGDQGDATPEESVGKTKKDDKENLDKAQKMHEEGALSEAALTVSLEDGKQDFAAASLSVLASVPLAMVRRIIGSKNGKAVTALTRKAGLTMGMAVKFQQLMAHISPAEIIQPKGNGEFPLSEEEGNWQIDFFKRQAENDSSSGEEDDGQEEEEAVLDRVARNEAGGENSDPDWVGNGGGGRHEPDKVDPDWADKSKARAKAKLADPDWAGDEGREKDSGPVDLDWAENEGRKKDRGPVDLDWAENESREKDSGPVDLDWAENAPADAPEEPDWAKEEPEDEEDGSGGKGNNSDRDDEILA